MEGHWKFQGGGGSQMPKLLKAKYEAKLEFSEGLGEFKLWIFSATTTQCYKAK